MVTLVAVYLAVFAPAFAVFMFGLERELSEIRADHPVVSPRRLPARD
ncbi:MAG: hypothetical protein NW217_15785 [Hyphomicrobiaceae bacterium]|nr:hypothetical protein [Hyphomicrobiaceae bacterium]